MLGMEKSFKMKVNYCEILLRLWLLCGAITIFSGIVAIIFSVTNEPEIQTNIAAIISGISGFIFFGGIFYAIAES